jgi:hypothetical protein
MQIDREATQTQNINNLSKQWKIKSNAPQKKEKKRKKDEKRRKREGGKKKKGKKRAQKTRNLLTQRKSTNGITKNKCNNVLGGQ